jgi:carbamoyl-phosphate synthase large subunit
LILGADSNPLSPALYTCDKHVINRRISDPAYMPELLAVAKKHKIHLLIPTIDTELKGLAECRHDFAAIGTTVLVSAPKVIDICQDKRKTFQFATENGFGSAASWDTNKVRSKELPFPVFMKPWDGSASRGNTVAHDAEEFRYWRKRIPNCLVQELILGTEYTCDAYVDFNMKVRCVVPRKRIEVRAGEVSKGQTAKIPKIMDEVKRLVEVLGAGPGVITVQCFLTPNDEIKIVEINPRFGGGAPLSIQAGADFPKWVLQELIGRKPKIVFDGWQDGVYMLRYDEAIWCRQRTVRGKSVLVRTVSPAKGR